MPEDDAGVRVRCSTLPTGGGGGREPQGGLLAGAGPRLHDEEVSREGARVTRAFQHARWNDGSAHLWIGQRRAAGRGEGSRGLRFAYLEGEGP